jgi:predicted ATPase
MQITRIALQNFKCFKNVDVSLSRITLLTGGNSSGKSSLLYGILAPFQSNEFPFYLSPNGKYVNMGDFEEMSFKNDIKSKIGIDLSEYLLNRIRLAIVKDEIQSSDVSIYYFENSLDGSLTHQIEFTKDGQIKNAPKGFFDTYMIDTMDIALHA